jgi:hypothetical protein
VQEHLLDKEIITKATQEHRGMIQAQAVLQQAEVVADTSK